MNITMKHGMDALRIHRSWEDWTSIGLGALVVISPWSASSLNVYVTLSTVILGVLICCVSGLDLEAVHPAYEGIDFVLGLLLVASPWLLGYSHYADLATTHYILGGVVAVLAAFEYWQDARRPAPTK